MKLVGFDQSDMPVNTCSGIPTRTQFLRIHSDCNDIFRIKANIGRKIYPEGNVAIGTFSYLLSVKIYLRIGHHAIKIKKKHFIFIYIFDVEAFTIPADSPPR